MIWHSTAAPHGSHRGRRQPAFLHTWDVAPSAADNSLSLGDCGLTLFRHSIFTVHTNPFALSNE